MRGRTGGGGSFVGAKLKFIYSCILVTYDIGGEYFRD